ncbi:hypothetical protein ABEG17_00200 [Pedococcus sp. KACC 23699]|uniref:Uncharacterized protein n=1 Tax=Pedococcus sp. KACC 23699 TaxID=3149228 RepID=A0AAU7JTP2_9MICO
MGWLKVLGGLAIVSGVLGYVVGLRDSRRNDEAERGLLAWMLLAWLGVAVLLVAELA